jgi:uracil-DNA glycosylase
VTPFQLHVNRWGDCQQCELHRVRHKVVLARGRVPCDVLFIGEAPGASEDVLGLPFVGPAGHMLDYIIERSIGEHNELRKEKGLPGLRVAMTNLVCCMIDMVHPAYILRATMAQRDSLIGASVVSIANSLEEVF